MVSPRRSSSVRCNHGDWPVRHRHATVRNHFHVLTKRSIVPSILGRLYIDASSDASVRRCLRLCSHVVALHSKPSCSRQGERGLRARSGDEATGEREGNARSTASPPRRRKGDRSLASSPCTGSRRKVIAWSSTQPGKGCSASPGRFPASPPFSSACEGNRSFERGCPCAHNGLL